MKRFLFVFSFLILTTHLYADNPSRPGLPMERIKLPPGFHISLFAENVEDARSMAWNGKDTLYVGTRGKGSVYALVDSSEIVSKEPLINPGILAFLHRPLVA